MSLWGSWVMSCSSENASDELDRDDERDYAGGERDDRCEEPQADMGRVGFGLGHPLAWSTISAVNGGPLLGVTWNESPHLPTMTSAGAARA